MLEGHCNLFQAKPREHVDITKKNSKHAIEVRFLKNESQVILMTFVLKKIRSKSQSQIKLIQQRIQKKVDMKFSHLG